MPESSGIGIWSKRVGPLPWRIGVPRVERRRPHPRGALWGSSCGMLESTTGTGRPLSKIAINRAAMGDPQCENHEFGVFDRVDNPVVTDPDPPEVWISDERSCAARSRADVQGVDGLDDAARCWLVELG